MKEQFTHKVTQSMLMWMEHHLCDDGEAYINVNTQFYNAQDRNNGYYSYSCPYDQFLSDASVNGSITPNLLTGIYISGNYTNVGQNGFIAADFHNGLLYFDHEIQNPSTNLTGSFSIKEVNTMLTTESEETLLFDTAFKPKMDISKNYSGMKQNETNIPVIFLKYIGGNNVEFAFGGMDESIFKYRALVFAESLYQLEGISSIFRDKQNTEIPLISRSDNPFNFLGYYTGPVYNYENLANSKTESSERLCLKKVYINNFDGFTIKQRKDMPRGSQLGIIDFEVFSYRYPRV